MRTLLASAAVLALTSCFSPPAHTVEVRPMRVRVVDAATKRPLAGVPVAYALETMVMRDRILGVVRFPIEPDIGPRVVYKARGSTDANGEIELRAGTLLLRGNERPYQEFVAVNLDVDMAEIASRLTLESLEATCATKRPTCAASPPDGMDVAVLLYPTIPEERVKVFRNPIGAYRGALLVNIPSLERYEGYQDFTVPEDRFRLAFNFSLPSGGPQSVVLELESRAGSTGEK